MFKAQIGQTSIAGRHRAQPMQLYRPGFVEFWGPLDKLVKQGAGDAPLMGWPRAETIHGPVAEHDHGPISAEF